MTARISDTPTQSPVAAIALFMQRPDPADRMPQPLRRLFFWGALVGMAGGGLVMWFAAVRTGSSGWTSTGQTLAGIGLIIYLMGKGLAWLGSHVNAYCDRQEASRELSRRAQDAQPTTFAALAADPDPDMRQRAAHHPDCPPEQLEVLAGDTHRQVRKAVARNRSTPEAVLLRIADDGDPIVCQELLVHWDDDVPDAVRERILQPFV